MHLLVLKYLKYHYYKNEIINPGRLDNDHDSDTFKVNPILELNYKLKYNGVFILKAIPNCIYNCFCKVKIHISAIRNMTISYIKYIDF